MSDTELLEELMEKLGIAYTKTKDCIVVGDKAFIYHDLYIPGEYSERGWANSLMKQYREQGITLFQLTSDIPAIKLMRFLKIKLSLLPKVYARNCIIGDLPREEFFRYGQYHIQGPTNSSTRKGLFHEGKLVGAIGFIKESDGMNLNRLIFGDVQVIGGASKLFKPFESNSVITYSNNGYSNGGIYSRLGFESANEVDSDLWYIKDGRLLNRRNFQKKKLPGILPIFDESLTEVENMRNNDFGVYYGPGTIKWTRN
jgi:hypothetical protein